MPYLDELLETREVGWDQLLLDPSNPRLFSLEAQGAIVDEEIAGAGLQEFLLTELRRTENIEDLVQRIRSLGFSTVDRLVVRPLAGHDNLFVVLEGNRRTAAVKTLMQNPVLKAALPVEIQASMEQIEVRVYTGNDPDAAWMFQGLRNMGGMKPWGPFQQAKFMMVLLEQDPTRTVAEIAEAAGVGPVIAGRLVRSFYGFSQAAQDPEYGGQLTPQHFAVFNEGIFYRNNSTIAQWLEWSDPDKAFLNEGNLTTLLSLLFPGEEGGLPKIARVNPDLRDYFRRIIQHDDQGVLLQQFLEGGIALQQAIAQLEHEDDFGAGPPGQAINLNRLSTRLTSAANQLQTLPTPAIAQEGRVQEFLQRLQTISEVAAFQTGILQAIPVDEPPGEQS